VSLNLEKEAFPAALQLLQDGLYVRL